MSDLNIESLLEPISIDSPCGENLEYDRGFMQLEELAKGTPEQQIGDLFEPAQSPNWRDVQREALELSTRTRDLRILLLLMRSELHMSGWPGFRDGLLLLQKAVNQYWPYLMPELDPEDGNNPEQRLNILSALNDRDVVLNPLSGLPLVVSKAFGSITLRDFQNIATRDSGIDGEGESLGDASRIHAAMEDAGSQAALETYSMVGECLAITATLENDILETVGIERALTFDPLTQCLQEIRRSLNRYILVPEGQGAGAADGWNDTSEAGLANTEKGIGAVNSRQDVVKALDMVCQYYEKNEPSSPLPLLLRRAKRLVSKSFMEVLKDLVPDGVAQAEVIRGPIDDE